MLSSILRSTRAVQVNIEIMRAFARVRVALTEHDELHRRLDAIEKNYDAKIKVVFDAIRELVRTEDSTTRRIGFCTNIPAADDPAG